MVAPRKYPEELRERSIRLALDARKSPASRAGACRRIGEQLGINPETLRGWVTQAEVDAGTRTGTTTADAARLAELEEVLGAVPIDEHGFRLYPRRRRRHRPRPG